MPRRVGFLHARANPGLALAATLCLPGAVALAPVSVLAQTASQITPQTFAPPVENQAGGLTIPGSQTLDAPAGAERLRVRVRRLDVQGGLPALAARTAAIGARVSGRIVTAAEIFAAARELEQAYAAEGFPLVRVVLPAQQLRNGADVRFLVVDGFIERVDVSTLPPEIRQRVAAVLASLVGERGLTLAQLERKLLLAGDTPGTVLRSTLAPGSASGATVLVVEARYKPITGFTGVDNTLSRDIGRYNASLLGLDLNSLTGNGETLYLRAFGLPVAGGRDSYFGSDPRNRTLAAGLILPLGEDGLNFTFEATDARTSARALPGTIGFDSDFSRYSARLRYPLIRGRNFTWNVEGDFDAQDERVNIRVPVETPFSLDRLRIARGATDFLYYLPSEGLFAGLLGTGLLGSGLPAGGVLTGRLTGSFGIDGLGAREAPPVGSDLIPLSRQGARPEFQKLDLFLSLTQPIAEHLTLAAFAHGQTSFDQALARSEQIGLATLTGLSTFDAGLFQGDEGFVTRGELQFPFLVPFTLPFALPSLPAQQGAGLPPDGETDAALVLSPYGFGAYGLVRQQNPTALERAVLRGAAYGGGLRLGAAAGQSFSSFSATVEYGRADRSDNLPSDDRLTFSVAIQF